MHTQGKSYNKNLKNLLETMFLPGFPMVKTDSSGNPAIISTE